LQDRLRNLVRKHPAVPFQRFFSRSRLFGELTFRLLHHCVHSRTRVPNLCGLLLEPFAPDFFLLAINLAPGSAERLLISGSLRFRSRQTFRGFAARAFGGFAPLGENSP
jgi:hypothetical protein